MEEDIALHEQFGSMILSAMTLYCDWINQMFPFWNGQAPPWLQPERWRLHVIDAVMIFRENIRPEWEVPAGGWKGAVVAFLRHGEDI